MGAEPSLQRARLRFEPEIIQELMEIEWWNWEVETIIRHHAVLMRGDMEELRAVARSLEK